MRCVPSLRTALESMEYSGHGTPDIFESQRPIVDAALKEALTAYGSLPLYGMLQYGMGYADQALEPTHGAAGKRIRASLLLLAAHLCGGAKSALDLAIAVELFHNFTLIHDDIEDHDEERRGRSTLWKVWGINHGINAGDAQVLITTTHLLNAAASGTEGALAAVELNQHFLQVVEGQYLDFELTDKPLTDPYVTVPRYLEMIRKKTAVLIGTAVAAGGVAAGCSREVRDILFTYGESFGMAYQIADDLSSIWGSEKETGKHAYGDIVERKKTYPILYARDQGAPQFLTDIYTAPHAPRDDEVSLVVHHLDSIGAREATTALGWSYVEKAHHAAETLPLPPEAIHTLVDLVHALVRFPPQTHAAD